MNCASSPQNLVRFSRYVYNLYSINHFHTLKKQLLESDLRGIAHVKIAPRAAEQNYL